MFLKHLPAVMETDTCMQLVPQGGVKVYIRAAAIEYFTKRVFHQLMKQTDEEKNVKTLK